MNPTRLRLGMHDFLNAQPLLLPLLQEAERWHLDVVRASPAALAEKLHAGDLDLAMIPSIEYLREADAYRLIPGVCIASRGPVGSVLLVCKKPLHEVRTLGVDNRSKTSAALLAILFERRLAPELVKGPAEPDPDRMLNQNDAALIIGDQAFLLDERHPELTFYDLSEEWLKKTGKSFVHAVLAVRPEAKPPSDLVRFLGEAASLGMGMLDEIAQSVRVKQSGLSPERCRDYLTGRIIYTLGETELDGLMHFRDICFKGKLLPHQHPIEFV